MRRARGGYIGSDRRDAVAGHRDVAVRVDVVLRINNVPALEQEIVPGLRGRAGRKKKNPNVTHYDSNGHTCRAVWPQIQRLSSAFRNAIFSRAISMACLYVQYCSTSGQSLPAISRFGPKVS